MFMPIRVAAQSVAWVCGLLCAVFAGLNLGGGMNVCRLRVLCCQVDVTAIEKSCRV